MTSQQIADSMLAVDRERRLSRDPARVAECEAELKRLGSNFQLTLSMLCVKRNK
jgi:hypothetical protein